MASPPGRSANFLENLANCLSDRRTKDCIRWSGDQLQVCRQEDDPQMSWILRQHFGNIKLDSLHRQLRGHGFQLVTDARRNRRLLTTTDQMSCTSKFARYVRVVSPNIDGLRSPSLDEVESAAASSSGRSAKPAEDTSLVRQGRHPKSLSSPDIGMQMSFGLPMDVTQTEFLANAFPFTTMMTQKQENKSRPESSVSVRPTQDFDMSDHFMSGNKVMGLFSSEPYPLTRHNSDSILVSNELSTPSTQTDTSSSLSAPAIVPYFQEIRKQVWAMRALVAAMGEMLEDHRNSSPCTDLIERIEGITVDMDQRLGAILRLNKERGG